MGKLPQPAPSVRWMVGIPLAVFLALGALVIGAWSQQVNHQRLVVASRTDEACRQASRRAEEFLRSQQATVELFTSHWASHEGQDHSRKRFEAYASLAVSQHRGFAAVARLERDLQSSWVTPADNQSLPAYVADDGRSLLQEAARRMQPVLSAPVRHETHTSLFSVTAMRQGDEPIAYLVFEFRAPELFDALYLSRIRSEFALSIDDGGQQVFHFAPDVPPAAFLEGPMRSVHRFPVMDRRWRMTVVPRPAVLEEASWSAHLALPGYGLLLSISMSVMTYLLLARIRDHRRARDDALREVAERRKAEEALRLSERRYRGVFDAAREGLLVLDEEGRVVEANAAACAMHGYELGELQGLDVRELIASDHRNRIGELMVELREAGSVQAELVDRTKDGREVEVDVRGTRFTHDGRPAALVILVDVTAHKTMLRQQAQLSRQVMEAQEEERGRLSRDLHDGLGQTLTALRFELDWLHKQLDRGAQGSSVSFNQANQLVESSAQELRLMCKGLRPPLLDDLGLVPAVVQLTEEVREHAALEVQVEIELDEDEHQISAEVALCAYRVLQEALTNVHRHARAQRVDVVLRGDDEWVQLTVCDDGCGFEVDNPSALQRFGIAGMRERAKLVGGTLRVRSTSGDGTTVLLRVPQRSLSEVAGGARDETATGGQEAS